MSFSVTCGACRTRLKMPDGCTKTKARCPRCDARVDVSAALAKPDPPIPAPVDPTGVVTEREDDPLPYLDLDPLAKTAKPTGGLRPPLAGSEPEVLSLDDDPPGVPPPAGDSATPRWLCAVAVALALAPAAGPVALARTSDSGL